MDDSRLMLVVDDDPFVRSLLGALLRSRGYTVLLAADGQSAWDILQTSPVRLVIADRMMPAMDGLELCYRIRHELSGPYRYVLMLTGLQEQDALIEGFEAGADDFLRKPLNPAELRVRVAAAERKLSLQRQLEQQNQELAAAYARIQADYRESESSRLIALDAGRMGAWWWNTRDRTCGGDAFFLTLFGLPPSQTLYPVAAFTERMAPQSAAATEAIMTAPPLPGQEFESELEIVSGPTAGRWIRWRGRADGLDSALIRGISFDITEQKRTEAALRASEERLQLATEAGGLGIFDADLITGGRDWDARLRELWGLGADEVITHEIFMAGVHPEDRVSVEAALARAFDPDGNGVYADEYRVLPRDGSSERWIAATGRVHFEGREPVRLVGTVQGITERKRTEEQLRAGEERLHLATEAAGLGILDVNLGTGRTKWDARLREIWGVGADEVITDEIFIAGVHPEDREFVRAAVARALDPDGNGLYAAEYRIRPLNGSGERWIAATGRVHFEGRRPVRLVGTVQDITVRKRTEERLRESEGRFRQFGEASSDVLWVRDAKTLAFEYLNPAFERVYGMSHEEALRGDRVTPWLEAIHPEDREKVLSGLRHVSTGESATYTYRVRHSDGATRWIRSTKFPLLNAMGRVQQIAGISRDVTEEVELQERLEVLVAELQHRTRNLLGVVRSLADKTIAGSASLPDFRVRFRDRLDALARVNGLLSRLEEGGRITFDELLGAELLAHGALQAGGHGAQVSLSGPLGVRLRSSTVQTIALALHELATNAVKHGALSRPEGRLAVRWSLVDGTMGEPRLQVEWRESGLPFPSSLPVGGSEDETPAAPRRGFGRDLIERILPVQLKAATSYRLTPDGLHCTITLPVSSRAPASFAPPDAGGSATLADAGT